VAQCVQRDRHPWGVDIEGAGTVCPEGQTPLGVDIEGAGTVSPEGQTPESAKGEFSGIVAAEINSSTSVQISGGPRLRPGR